MDNGITTGIITVALGIIGLATVAVIFSDKAQTGKVVTSGGNALATNILAAVSPITGTAPMISTQF